MISEQPEQNLGSAASVWDEVASHYDAARINDPVYLSCVKAVARAIPYGLEACLDAGCGTGLVTELLSRKCRTVTAVDFSHASLEQLELRRIPNVVTVQADLTRLPFDDSVFDACVCANTLQHLNPNGQQQAAIQELTRVTRPGGTICISVHHYSKRKCRAGWIKEGKPGQPGIDYIYRFTYQDLQQLMPTASIIAAGFYRAASIPLVGSFANRILGCTFGARLARTGYGHMLVAIARVTKETH